MNEKKLVEVAGCQKSNVLSQLVPIVKKIYFLTHEQKMCPPDTNYYSHLYDNSNLFFSWLLKMMSIICFVTSLITVQLALGFRDFNIL